MIKYHLPGLFEFYELYSQFLDLYVKHREYFFEWCEIGSIYGSPKDCIWGGGRIEDATTDVEAVIELVNKYQISARLAFSNSLLEKEHLEDKHCNDMCRVFAEKCSQKTGVIIYSDLLMEYLKERYDSFYFISSTTKVLTDFVELVDEINRDEFSYVVPDFRINVQTESLGLLDKHQKDKVEFLCNECCFFGCKDRKECYEVVSLKNLGKEAEHYCKAPDLADGYSFSKAMSNPGFIGIKEIKELYEPMGFTNFKIEGRSLGSAMILEFLLYYMVKPQYHIHVREKLYLSNMLDLF